MRSEGEVRTGHTLNAWRVCVISMPNYRQFLLLNRTGKHKK